jgi:ABC-type lipopolysaccharide export system ATPase subunit
MQVDIAVGSVEEVIQAIRDIALQVGKSSNRRHKAAATQLRERTDQLVEALRMEEMRNARGKWYLAPLPVATVGKAEVKSQPAPELEAEPELIVTEPVVTEVDPVAVSTALARHARRKNRGVAIAE